MTVAIHPPTVLLVDDDEDARFLLCSMLQRRGLDVDTADSAHACLAQLSKQPVTIVVTDIQMPGMSGLELCRVLRARHPDVIAIVMSGLATADIAVEALETGAVTFLRKPVSADALELAIHDAAATRRTS